MFSLFAKSWQFIEVDHEIYGIFDEQRFDFIY